jgi:dihydrofolate reductase
MNTTWGMPIIMGRKTLESMDNKPLPARTNIVITSKKDWKVEGVAIVNTWNDAMFVANSTDSKEVFVIGGGEIFKDAIKKANRIYMTRVHTFVDGNVFFPEIDPKKWKLVNSRPYKADEKHAFDYTFEVWEPK